MCMCMYIHINVCVYTYMYAYTHVHCMYVRMYAYICALFLTYSDNRLGKEGATQVKVHTFFNTQKWEWNSIRKCPAPFIPEIKSDDDTEYFDEIDPEKGDIETFPPASVSVCVCGVCVCVCVWCRYCMW